MLKFNQLAVIRDLVIEKGLTDCNADAIPVNGYVWKQCRQEAELQVVPKLHWQAHVWHKVRNRSCNLVRILDRGSWYYLPGASFSG